MLRVRKPTAAAIRRAHATSRAGELRYVQALGGIMRSLHLAVVAIVEPGFGFLAGRRLDVTRWGLGLEDRLSGLLEQLETHTGPAFDSMARTVATQNLKTQTDLLGARPSSSGVDVEVAIAREENLRLMRVAAEAYANDIVQVMDSPATWDLTLEELMAVVQQAGIKSMQRAALIARDQVYKLNAALSRRRQENAGGDSYCWSTCRDERVRKTHRANEGIVFMWSNPSPITGHPGHDPNCRCLALPVGTSVQVPTRAEKIAELMKGMTP